MLISLGSTIKLPKLTIETSTKGNTPRVRTVLDDTLEVTKRMEQLFSKYKWKTVTTEKELLAYLTEKKELGLDCETTALDIYKGKLCGFSLGTEDDCIYIPLTHKVGKNYQDDIGRLEEHLKGIDLWGFNLKFDLKAMKLHAGIQLKGIWCGYLAARLMDCTEPANNLKDLYIKYIDADEPFYSFGELFKRPFDTYDPEIVGGYAAVDAMKHIRLGKYQIANIRDTDKKIIIAIRITIGTLFSRCRIKRCKTR